LGYSIALAPASREAGALISAKFHSLLVEFRGRNDPPENFFDFLLAEPRRF
jgi:hypothetical protein